MALAIDPVDATTGLGARGEEPGDALLTNPGAARPGPAGKGAGQVDHEPVGVDEGLAGAWWDVDLGDGLKLLGWGLVTDPKPDDDDEVWSNLQICVHNTGTQPVARLEVKLRMLKRSGEEVDDGRCEIDGILPGQFRGDDASLRFATRWLKKGVTAEFIIKALRVVARATAEPSELELRPR